MTQLLDYEAGSTRIGAWRHALAMSAPTLTVFTILSAWLSALFGAVLFPVPLVLVGLLTVQRRWRLLVLSAALSPLGVGFVVGVVSYCIGNARVQGMGLPGLGYYNLDPELRCERSSGGCLVNGGEVLTQAPNNVAVVALTRLFGPQPGAYIGPYPSETQAKGALASAGAVSVEALLRDRVDLTQPPIRLDRGVGAGLLERLQLTLAGGQLDAFSRQTLKDLGPIRATLYQSQCLILRVPMHEAAMIVLIDTKTGRPFAYYGEGQFHQRYPPVPWRK